MNLAIGSALIAVCLIDTDCGCHRLNRGDWSLLLQQRSSHGRPTAHVRGVG